MLFSPRLPPPCHATQHTGVHVRFHAVHTLSLVPPGTADTAALRYSTIASLSLIHI